MAQALISAPGELTTVSQNVYNVGGQRVTRLDGTWTDASDSGVYDNGVIDKDSNGLVVGEEITAPDTSRYYYTGSELLYSANENNSLLTENIVDPSGTIIASKRFDQYDGGYYFYDYDNRGSTTAIIAPTGALVKAYTYDEFGNTQETTQSAFNNEVTFTSSVTDESTGLQYMNSRFYNPSTGRFLSQDSYSGNAYEPWTQHLYSYCGNNLTNFIDPTGHRPIRGDDPSNERWTKKKGEWVYRGVRNIRKLDQRDKIEHVKEGLVKKDDILELAADDLITASETGIQIDNQSDLAETYKSAFGNTYDYSKSMGQEVYERFGDRFDSGVSAKALTYEIYGHVRVYDMVKGIPSGNEFITSLQGSTSRVDTLFSIDADPTLKPCVTAADWGWIYSVNDEIVAETVAAGFIAYRAHQHGLLF